jgi:hypothetical protein
MLENEGSKVGCWANSEENEVFEKSLIHTRLVFGTEKDADENWKCGGSAEIVIRNPNEF